MGRNVACPALGLASTVEEEVDRGSLEMKLILLAILAVVLAANNPSENDFEDYVGDKIAKNEIAKKMLSKEGNILTPILELLSGLPCFVDEPFSPEFENYFVFSLYTIDLGCFEGPKVVLLGVAGQIFPINTGKSDKNKS